MATLLLQAGGAALGGLFGPVGAIIGRAAGALAGNAIDRQLLGGDRDIEGPRLPGARIGSADEGAGIARVYGTVRIGGTLIWATRFEEEVSSERRGGKGSSSTVEAYSYYANFAVGLCEGPVSGVRRIWADGRELDLSSVDWRLHNGTEGQAPDPLIAAKQGAGETPAYRGLAYVVFERLPLDGFGNRIPVLNFEVMRPTGALERDLKAITVIPGSTEHGYLPRPVSETTGDGESRVMNRHVVTAGSDWEAAIDELQRVCPALQTVALVCAWFGDDLRAGECRLLPGVEVTQREDESEVWSVSGIDRQTAHVVSTRNGAPAYGGSPSDKSVLEAIADLRARGLKVFLYPFILMDIAPDNDLPDPNDAPEQPPYPWRGRITCFPGPEMAASADATAAARAQVVAFCGEAVASDYSVSGDTVAYAGTETGYRRLVLHYAHLAEAAGGVDGFVIGSEMRAMTRLRDETGAFPFVEQLESLAEEVASVVRAGTAITYAADWSEYFGYQPADGSGDVFFNLDPLWMNNAIKAVAIDNYMPLADWRDGDVVAGNPDGFATPTDTDAMRAQITAGEGFDWYYRNDDDRQARQRTAITDGAAGKPWVFRFKDLEAWWSNPHFERADGEEASEPTVWVPRSKPIWFTELGCPAVDKGANQPNVFPDAKSSEGRIPYFSSGARSDLMQRRFLEAHLAHWTEPSAPAGMVDPDLIFAWTWDARPYPAFPNSRNVWTDGENWRTGHWLTGRLGATTPADLITAILSDHGFDDFTVEDLGGDLTGYVQSEPASARAILEPLLDLFQADAIETSGWLTVRSRTRRVQNPVEIEAVVDRGGAPMIEATRAQAGDLAIEAVLDHYDVLNDFVPATARSRRLDAALGTRKRHSLALATQVEAAEAEVDFWLRDHWSGRDRTRFELSPSALAFEPGDRVRLAQTDGRAVAIERIEDGASRRIVARGLSSGLTARSGLDTPNLADRPSAAAGWSPVIRLIDLPILEGNDEQAWAMAAAFSKPWRPLSFAASAGTQDYRTRLTLDRPARMGVLSAPLAPGSPGRLDRGGAIRARFFFDGPSSVDLDQVLNGANVLAIETASGGVEIVQFTTAEEVEAGEWLLTGLLRGQAGTEDAMSAGADTGAGIVMIDGAVRPLELKRAETGIALNWRAISGGKSKSVATHLTLGLRAATPLAPVHLRARRLPTEDVAVTWVRRARIDADSWLAADIPLDAAREAYRLEILSGDVVRRTIDVEEPAYLYDGDLQISDFGLLPEVLQLRVRQFGDRVPLGIAAKATITL